MLDDAQPPQQPRLATGPAVVHLVLSGHEAACGLVKGPPSGWPTQPVPHTWVRRERAWMLTCRRCQEIARATLSKT